MISSDRGPGREEGQAAKVENNDKDFPPYLHCLLGAESGNHKLA